MLPPGGRNCKVNNPNFVFFLLGKPNFAYKNGVCKYFIFIDVICCHVIWATCLFVKPQKYDFNQEKRNKLCNAYSDKNLWNLMF